MEAQFGFTADDTVLITGAASGIGRATALAAAHAGLNVGAWDMNANGLRELAAELEQLGVRSHAEVIDVGDDEAIARAMTATVATLGPIRYLHNNAGPASSSSLDFLAALQLCVGSVQRITDAWAQHRPDGAAAMVVTSSIAGNLVGTESNWYSASKAALMGYVRHLAAHRAEEFRSNAVGPGMTLTPRIAPFAQSERGKQVLERIPLKRMATAEDIAWATLFLLSPLASYINGVFLPVDGGWTVTQ